MSITKTHVIFDSEELSAIEQFIPEKIQSVETQLREQLEKNLHKISPSVY